MRFFTIIVLSTTCAAFASTYEQCRESINSASQFFSSYDLSSYILGNDVFAVLGRIPETMEITLVSDSPLRLDISNFTTLGSESICNIQIALINLSAIVFIRDSNLTPDLRTIIDEKYFLGQLLSAVYCSGLVTSSNINACCIYEQLQSKRSLSIDQEPPRIKRVNTRNVQLTPSFSTDSPSGFSFGAISIKK